MPSAVQGKAQKRKRTTTTAKEPPKKRARSESSDDHNDDDNDDDPQAQILLLEAAILESKKHYNNITTLLSLAQDVQQDEDTALLAAVALCRVFIRLLAGGSLRRRKNMPDKEIVVVHWLRDRLAEYHRALVSFFARDERAPTALTLSMRLLKAEGQNPQSDKDEYSFPKSFLKDIVRALCQPEVDSAVRKDFIEKFVDEFEDVRFYAFRAVHEILGEREHGQGPDTRQSPTTWDAVFEMLSSIEGVPESREEFEHFYIAPPQNKKGHELFSVSKHKKQAQDAWLALMRLDVDRERRKQLLDVMSRVIAPWFAKPELLMDFLTDSYNTGGSMSLLALSGVFYLIQERNLDYPAFYTKLYSLLDADLLHSRYRSRFFRLLDVFLASSHLPAALVASFIKRLSRLSLHAPPSAVVTVVPWMYNLFRKHPTCTFMMHRVPPAAEGHDSLSAAGLEDPFLPDEQDPMATRAIDSCVWEIVQLQSHYHPNVATIAKILSEQFTKQFYNMEDFLDHSYASLLEAEMVKKVKKAPVVEYQIPKRIFLPHEVVDSGQSDGLLVKLWGFT